MAYVIGLDIGTTSTIGILIELPSRIVAIVSRPVELLSLHPAWAEEEPEQWWSNVGAIATELLTREPKARDALAAIGVAGMVPALVMLDAEGAVVRRSIQQSDGRCADEVVALAQEIDPADFLRRTGNGLNQQVIAAKLRWLESHEPDTVARAATVFGSYDFIAWKLTGERSVERNWALEAGFVDLATGLLSDALIALGRISPALLPPLRRGDAIVGRVTTTAARETGLPAGTPVVGGAADHVASAYAAGVVEEGDVLLKFGGAGDVLLATAQARPDARVFLDYHVVPGLFMPNGCMATTGSLLNWLTTMLPGHAGETAAGPHENLDALAADVAPGSEGVMVLPYFLGEKSPIHDPRARGTITGLSISHGPGHLWRATLESTAYAFAHHLEVFRDIGYPVTRLLASDGGSRSDVWMQIMADVARMPVATLTSHPGSCLGSAWVAAMGSGGATEWSGVSAMVGKGRVFAPTAETQCAYAEGYSQFRDLYTRLAPWFARRPSP